MIKPFQWENKNPHRNKLVNQALLKSNIGTIESNKKYKQVPITICPSNNALKYEGQIKEKPKIRATVSDWYISNLIHQIDDPSSQNEEPMPGTCCQNCNSIQWWLKREFSFYSGCTLNFTANIFSLLFSPMVALHSLGRPLCTLSYLSLVT